MRLPTSASVPISRRLLIISSAQDSSPAGTRGDQPEPAQRGHLHVGGAGHRRQPEEREDRDLTQPAVPVRMAAAGVEPGGPDGGRRPTRMSHQDVKIASTRPATHAQKKQANAAASTCRAGARPAATSRVGPTRCLVRAADAVAVVVGVVDADLQRERHDQGEHGAPGGEPAVAEGDPGADEDGDDRGRQRPRPGTRQPVSRLSQFRSFVVRALRRAASGGPAPRAAARSGRGRPCPARSARRRRPIPRFPGNGASPCRLPAPTRTPG